MKSQLLSLLIVVVIGIVAAATVWLVSQLNNGTTENSSIIIPSGSNVSNVTSPNSSNRNSTPSTHSTNVNSATGNQTNQTLSGTTGDNVNDFGACDTAAHTYCSGFYSADWEAYAAANGYRTASWKYGLVDCLGAHRDETSQACDDSLDRRQSLNEDLVTACAADRGTYCRGVEPQPGSEPMVDCLGEHYDQLSADCAAAFDAHAAAKPTQ